MKRLFVLGLVLGFVGVLAAAYLVPWVSYTRYASQTSVVANGGRAEQFIIRLPADRIESHTAAPHGVEDASEPAVPAAIDVDHYKLRDRSGNVVGLAARHAVAGDTPSAAWLLTIPSRGAVMLGGAARAPEAVDALLAEQGWVPGEPWTGDLVVTDVATAESVAATYEFAGLSMELSELWNITGVDADGELRGTIELNTIGRQGT